MYITGLHLAGPARKSAKLRSPFTQLDGLSISPQSLSPPTTLHNPTYPISLPTSTTNLTIPTLPTVTTTTNLTSPSLPTTTTNPTFPTLSTIISPNVSSTALSPANPNSPAAVLSAYARSTALCINAPCFKSTLQDSNTALQDYRKRCKADKKRRKAEARDKKAAAIIKV